MDGYINLLKPAGMTSHDAVAACRRILRMKKIGHTGTLDPMACGVMCICAGKATRAAEYLESDRKSYRCELRLGITSDTGDIWGRISPGDMKRAESVTKQEILEALEKMKGRQLQYPPMYSAVKVNGRKLYEYARKGETAEVKPRPVTIYDIRPVRILEEPGTVVFDADCSKGTYIRTLCTDLGDTLGCGAAMSFLLRTSSGRFHIRDAVTFEEILGAVTEAEGRTAEEILEQRINDPLTADLSRFILPVDSMLDGFGALHLSEAGARRFVNGNEIRIGSVHITEPNTLENNNRFSDLFRVYGPENRFLGTARADRRKELVIADKVFYR